MFGVFLLVALAGCAPKTRYTWNNYDGSLYQFYKNPAEHEELLARLRTIIDAGEKAGNVPPGIYAEYGYALYEKGSYADASKNFKLEQDKWPESRFLMEKMIRIASIPGKKRDLQNQESTVVSAEQQLSGAARQKGALP
jgi:hypothetical protein